MSTDEPASLPVADGVSTVLVADDDPAIRSVLGRALAREGFATVMVSDGREAIEQIERQSIALVLLDVHMPILGGLETLRRIRAADRSATLPVILVTGSGAESERVRGLESGADDYLAKPFAIDELIARVRAQIRGRAAWRRELERGRAGHRRLAAMIDGLPRDVPLVMLATRLVEQLPAALDIDGVALLHFAGRTVRTIASSGALRARFGAAGPMDRRAGHGLLVRAASGPWLEDAAGQDQGCVDIAYVPFRLAPTPQPLGCLAFALEPGASTGPLSHRLPDLIDAADFIVAVLRPAVEQAETADAGRSRLRRVINRQEFEIYLQPIVRLDTGVRVAVEALTRFADRVPPDVRFAEAATLGLSRSLQRATVAAAIQAAADLEPGVGLFINLSASVLRLEPSLPRIVAARGRRRPLVIEITEHERIDDYGAVRAALGGLGPDVELAVDDAGSGYATLKHILALRPAYVKLDMEWVRRIDRDPVRRALVSGLAYFARETGCELIAEGIETEAELRALRELGMTLGQGFLFGRPAPASAGR